MLSSGPAAGRSFDKIVTPTEITELRPNGRDDPVVMAIGGGGDKLAAAPLAGGEFEGSFGDELARCRNTSVGFAWELDPEVGVDG